MPLTANRLAPGPIHSAVPPLWYSMYGRRFRSDFPLPVPADAVVGSGMADCEFVRAPLGARPPEPDVAPIAGLACHEPCHNGRMVTLVHRSASGSWFWQESVGTCFVHPAADRVDIYPEADFDQRALGLMLLGQVATLVLHKQGFPTLHASAVVVEGKAIAFVGLPGQGKSTMAANFLNRGATLLTDDVLPLTVADGIVVGIPSLPMMKVWDQTAEHTLALRDELPSLSRTLPKKLLTLDGRFDFANAPVPVGGVYMVSRFERESAGRGDVELQAMNRVDGLKLLLTNVLNRAYMLPAENAGLLPLLSQVTKQATVGVLRYPNGFDRQQEVYDEVYARVVAELQTR